MMKSYVLAVAVFSMSILALAGCANEGSKSAAAGTNPTDRTLTSKDLQHTGRQDTAGAAAAADPSVTVTSGRR